MENDNRTFFYTFCSLERCLTSRYFAYLEAPHMLNGHVFGLTVARLQIFVQCGKNLSKETFDSVSDLIHEIQ